MASGFLGGLLQGIGCALLLAFSGAQAAESSLIGFELEDAEQDLHDGSAWFETLLP